MSDNLSLDQKMILSSVPVRKINQDGMPIDSASGCFVEGEEMNYFLTVSHATGDQGDWRIDIQWNSDYGKMLTYRLGDMMFFETGKLGIPFTRDLDFSYQKVPKDVNSLFQIITENGRVEFSKKRLKFEITDIVQADKNLTYGFFGQVPDDESKVTTDLIGVEAFTSVPTFQKGLKFEEKLENGDYLKFSLPGEHPGHEKYGGTSGAPILDSQGRLVSLVRGGDEDENVIYGLNLFKHKAVFSVR